MKNMKSMLLLAALGAALGLAACTHAPAVKATQKAEPCLPTVIAPQAPAIPPNRFDWPDASNRYSSLIEALKVIDNSNQESAVVVMMADWCPACRAVSGFWAGRQFPAPVYVVDTERMSDHEMVAVAIMGLPTAVPACLVFQKHGREMKTIVGKKGCTEGLLALLFSEI